MAENNLVLYFSLLILLLLIIVLFHAYNTKCKTGLTEKFASDFYPATFGAIPQPYSAEQIPADANKNNNDMYEGSNPYGNSSWSRIEAPEEVPKFDINACYPKDSLSSKDLLPKDAADSKWAQMNPNTGGTITDGAFLNADYLLGYNSRTGLRNPSLQLRSDPPIVRESNGVGPWNQSTIEPHIQRHLEIGSSPSY